mmetsp:Transcript_5887/g.18108  ORF Transcript_5887/g.18108 Transcript_5887/m.18108 type:complete len:220 (-) Transcript_5887:4060-4719(-)
MPRPRNTNVPKSGSYSAMRSPTSTMTLKLSLEPAVISIAAPSTGSRTTWPNASVMRIGTVATVTGDVDGSTSRSSEKRTSGSGLSGGVYSVDVAVSFCAASVTTTTPDLMMAIEKGSVATSAPKPSPTELFRPLLLCSRRRKPLPSLATVPSKPPSSVPKLQSSSVSSCFPESCVLFVMAVRFAATALAPTAVALSAPHPSTKMPSPCAENAPPPDSRA